MVQTLGMALPDYIDLADEREVAGYLVRGENNCGYLPSQIDRFLEPITEYARAQRQRRAA